MSTDAILTITHHIFAFALMAFLAMEWALLHGAPERSQVKRLAFIDAGYGAAALGSLGVGIARLAWGLKPWAYYSENPIFWAKMAVWGVIGAISIVPTLRYLKWRKMETLPSVDLFASTRRLVMLQLILFPLIPTLAALMARGYGY